MFVTEATRLQARRRPLFQTQLRRSVLRLPTAARARRGGDARRHFLDVAFGVESEQAGEDAVARLGRPEIAALVGVVVLGFLSEEFRTQSVG